MHFDMGKGSILLIVVQRTRCEAWHGSNAFKQRCSFG